ncbi:MAG TPA: hypothetical protein VHZ25_17745 [Acidobacteriaceae bacterium]|jgi:hypothetical protein|nr:hypothetical protein [Acidobacteriaceae bacterium]
MGAPFINYIPAGAAVSLNFKNGPLDFLAQDSGRVHDNLSTSGIRERLLEKVDILISFTMPALLVGDDFTDWKNFYAWAIGGGTFSFAPNVSVLYAPAPWSGGVYFFTCVLEDDSFAPKRVGLRRYSIDCKFRVFNDALTPANAGMVTEAFWGDQPL